MAEYVVSTKHGRPMFVVEAPNIGAVNLTLMRHAKGFDGTIRPLAEAEAEATGYDTRQRERLSNALQRLGLSGDGPAVRDLTESRGSQLWRLPHYRIPSGGLPGPSSSSGSRLLSERTAGAPSAPSAQTVELRERAVRALGRLGVSEEVALRGL